MIAKVNVKSGVLKNILGDTSIEFNPGVNVIWGRNGIGKSLLLKTMANYCFVDDNSGGGWSGNHIWFRFSTYDFKYKSEDKNLSDVYEFDKKSKIDIDWSGDACFYMHHDDIIDRIHSMGYEMNGSEWIRGLGKIGSVYKKHEHHPSTGQLIKGVAEMLLNITPPDLSVVNETYRNRSISEYVKLRNESFVGERKPTLLLDEVDSQLDLLNQIWFHKELIPKLSKKFQIIMVSHSIFAACYYNNIIELDDSLSIVQTELKNIIKQYGI